MPKLFSYLKLNKIIWFLTLSDIFTWGVYTTLSSLAGIYLSIKLGTGVIAYVGIGTALYSLTRAASQIPFGMFEDKIRQERDEVIILLISSLLMGTPFLFYPFISQPEIYYILQIVFGLGCGINLVSWRKLFAKSVSINKEGFAYGFYETIMSIFIAIFSATAGFIANLNEVYFERVIFTIGVIMILGSIWPVFIYKEKYLQ